MATTYSNLYLDTRRVLQKAGLPGASLEARELVCYATGKTKEELMRDGTLYTGSNTERKVKELVERHLKGEPVAYLIGEWEFYGIPLDITKDVLIPRPDTEVLAREAIDYIRKLGNCHVLDLCAGSGCVGTAVACHAPAARLVLADCSDGALHVCRQNIRRNGLSGRAVTVKVDALAAPDRNLGKFDCIVCNPPYIPTRDIEGLDVSVKDYEPLLALNGGEDGLDFYRNIAQKWKDALHPGGRLYFEVGIGQADQVLRLMRTEGFGDLQIVRDTNEIPRVVYGMLCTEL